MILIRLALRAFSSIFDTCPSGQATSHSSRSPIPAHLAGKLVATCIEEQTAGSTEELGHCIGALELRWARVMHLHMCPCLL